MADDDGSKNKGSRFLKKSKWGKLFKEDDSENSAAFKLNEDVVDFLKPSVDNAAAHADLLGNTRANAPLNNARSGPPKLSISVAQRWPSAQEIKAAAAREAAGGAGLSVDTSESEAQVRAFGLASPPVAPLPTTLFNGQPKRRRHLNLTVGFSRVPPEIMGEGGDEAPDPPSEIGRRRAMLARSASERRAPSAGSREFGVGMNAPIGQYSGPAGMRVDPGQLLVQQQQQRQMAPPPGAGNIPAQRNVPLRRSQTSHNETSPAVQQRYAPPPSGPQHQHKSSLTRVPTGFESEAAPISAVSPLSPDVPQSGANAHYSHAQDGPGLPSRIRPTVDTRWGEVSPPGIDVKHHDDDDDEGDLHPGFGDLSSMRPPVSGGDENLPDHRRKMYAGISSPGTPVSPAALRAKEMRSNEGAAFRRASMMRLRDDADGETDEPSMTGGAPAPKGSDFSTDTHAPSGLMAPGPGSYAGSQPSAEARTQQHLVQQPTAAPNNPAAASSYTNATPPLQQQRSAHSFSRPRQNTETFAQHQQRQIVQSNVDRTRMQNREERSFSDPNGGLNTHTQGPSAQQTRSPAQAIVDQNSANSAAYSPQAPYDQRRSPLPAQAQQDANRGGQSYGQGFVAANNMRASREPSPDSRSRAFSEATHSSQHQYAPLRPPVNVSQNGSQQQGLGLNIHSRTNSHDGNPAYNALPNSARSPNTTSPRFPNQFQQIQQQPQPSTSQSPRSSTQAAFRTGPSPAAGYLSPARGSPLHSNRVPGGPSRTNSSAQSSPLPGGPVAQPESNPAADAALADFCSRVAHMKGVFALTAEREQPRDQKSQTAWLRAALWWFARGKTGIEIALRERDHPQNSQNAQSSPDSPRRELLVQAHVDLAKAWWILSEPLASLGVAQPDGTTVTPQQPQQPPSPEDDIRRVIATLCFAMKSVCLMMGRSGMLPPTHALIQGQDTRIWLDYPLFRAGATAALSALSSHTSQVMPFDLLDLMPLGDTRDHFAYTRFQVQACLATDDVETDRIFMPCLFTITRARGEYQLDIAIASQHDLINVRVSPHQSEHRRTLAWADVSWRPATLSMVMHLGRDYDLTVQLLERDFRFVWYMAEHSRSIQQTSSADGDELLVHEAPLVELQYADPGNPHALPSDKLRGCTAMLFERSIRETDGSGTRRKHRGHRLLLLTNPGHKALGSVSHALENASPIFFEFHTDTSAALNGTTAMVVRFVEASRQIRALLVFSDAANRQAFYDVLSGLNVAQNEMIVEKVTLTSLNIEPVNASGGQDSDIRPPHPALHGLSWQKLGVTNKMSNDPNNRLTQTVESEKLRVLARHAAGCITDRINLSKGELIFRLPTAPSPRSSIQPSIQILRQPQHDMTITVDARTAPQSVAVASTQLLQTVQQKSTIRTFTFASLADLHAFQASITGFTVRYDGIASSLAIARRMMVVPIYKKWEATGVRIQVVQKESVVRLIAFMEGFSHADALCFQVKSTDVFENVKGSKGASAAVRLVDAKFSLPHDASAEESASGDVYYEKAKRRYVNLEGLEYAEEHDDITIGFADEADRDRFGNALPAATSVSRGLTLKRRI